MHSHKDYVSIKNKTLKNESENRIGAERYVSE